METDLQHQISWLLNSIGFLSLLLTIFFLQAAFFSGVEAAFLKLDRVVINRLDNSTSFISRQIIHFLDKFDYFIISLLLYNLFNHTFAVVTATRLVKRLIDIYHPCFPWGTPVTIDSPLALGSILFILTFTFILLIVSEITPKRMAIRFSEKIAKLGTLPMLVIYTFFYPFSFLLHKFSRLFIRRITGTEYTNGDVFDKHEFINYVKLGAGAGVLKKLESVMLQNLINYKNISIKSLLVPRSEMQGFNLARLPDNIKLEIQRFEHNTIPVYNKLKDDVVGSISKKKFFFMENWEQINKQNIRKYLDKPIILPESKNIIDVLVDLNNSNQDIALITDEYGGIEGFVTYADIVKKLLGQDEELEKNPLEIKKVGPRYYLINPQLAIDKINDYFSVTIGCEHAETIGGYLIEELHAIPKSGTVWRDSFLEYTVKGATRRRITRLAVRVLG